MWKTKLIGNQFHHFFKELGACTGYIIYPKRLVKIISHIEKCLNVLLSISDTILIDESFILC